MAATQLNIATTPVMNFPTMSGLLPNLISGELAQRYIRDESLGSSKYITYNVQNTAYGNEDTLQHNEGKQQNKRNLKKDDKNSGRRLQNRRDEKDRRKLPGRRYLKDKLIHRDTKIKYNSTSSVTDVNSTSEAPLSIFKNGRGNNGNLNGRVEDDVFNATLINLIWPSSQTSRPSDMGYGNNSSSISASSIPTNYIIIFSTLFFLIGTIGISGNVLVVYIVLSDGKMRRSMTNMMILNLALADSLIILFGIPEIVMVLLDRGWQLGDIACSVNRTVLVCALYASVLTLVAVCIERYIAIVFPIKAHILCTKRRVVVVIGFIWLLSVACSCPTAVFNTVVKISNTQFCLTKFHDNRTKHDIYLRIYKYSESALFYIGPLVIQVVCYAVIGKRLFVDLDKLHRGGGGGGGISSASRPNGRGPTRAFNEAMRARKGVVKMLMASVAIYCLSYSPHQILLVYNTFSSMTFDETWVYLVFTTILAYVNSAANPFLYCVFSDNFRTNFKRILHNCMPCKICCCCESCSSCISCNDQKVQRPMTLHSYTEYTSLVRRNTQKQGQTPIITV